MKKETTIGIDYEVFIALLGASFGAGAGNKEITPEAVSYPLNKYRNNLKKLAQQWPSADCDLACGCAYQAGKKAAANADQTYAPRKIDEGCMKKACDELETRVSSRGPVCRED